MAATDIGGLLNVNKRRGPTSHDVVGTARRALGTQRVGHAGTLDPAAHGVLLLLFGRVTRLARFFLPYGKEYRLVVKLGAETSTGDDQGDVLYERPVPAGTYDGLAAAARSFVGDIAQEVPKFSAVKRDGEPLYRKARRGEAVSAPTRTVTVYRWEVEAFSPPTFTSVVACSGGTYVRALARDLGRKLGVGGHLVDLERLAVGPYNLAEALPEAELTPGVGERLFRAPHFVAAADLLPELPVVSLAAEEVVAVAHGRPVRKPAALGADAAVRLMTPARELIGVGVASADGRLQPDTVLIRPEEVGDY